MRRRCRHRRRIRWPWLWPIAIVAAVVQIAAFGLGWSDVVALMALPVAGIWMGCCCTGLDCGPCCRDRGCVSEQVDALITGLVIGNPDLGCSCNDPVDYTTLVTGESDYFDGVCLWEDDGDAFTPCPQVASVIAAGWPFITTSAFTLGFAQKRFECSGSIIETPGECWLTAIITGDSTTSGQPDSGPWTVIFEAAVAGPYPADCEGTHNLAYKCETGFVPCDWTAVDIEVVFVFNGACDPTLTFDPWVDDVDIAFESLCAEVNGTTDTLNNVSTLTPPPATQAWASVAPITNPGIWGVTASLVWDHAACDYALTLTQSGTTSCRLVGTTQTKHATPVSCDPFELLFEDFELEDDPVAGPCECGANNLFDVRITEP